MTLRQWAIYSTATGLFTGRHLKCDDKTIVRNTPAGCAAIEGRYDKLTQRVDIATGRVVAYERPASEIEAEQQSARERHARHRIAELELAQLRPMRELTIDANNAVAKQRLAEIDDEISGLRTGVRQS